jgi:hypothetical protein
MNLFIRWRSRGEVRHSNKANNKSVLIGNEQGLFDNIVGFEDVKSLFEMAIKAERPVHLLLCGPPSSGKSLFMSSLTKLERSYYTVGSSSTKSGIFDYLFEYRPRYFIVDELEKMNKKRPDKPPQFNGIRHIIRTKTQPAKDNPAKNLGICFM